MNCFPWDRSLSDLLYSTKTKTCNGNNNGCLRSTFAGNSALLSSDVIDFALFVVADANNSTRLHFGDDLETYLNNECGKG